MNQTIHLTARNMQGDFYCESSEKLKMLGIPEEHHLSMMKDQCTKWKTRGYTVKLQIEKHNSLILEDVII